MSRTVVLKTATFSPSLYLNVYFSGLGQWFTVFATTHVCMWHIISQEIAIRRDVFTVPIRHFVISVPFTIIFDYEMYIHASERIINVGGWNTLSSFTLKINHSSSKTLSMYHPCSYRRDIRINKIYAYIIYIYYPSLSLLFLGDVALTAFILCYIMINSINNPPSWNSLTISRSRSFVAICS